MHTSDTRPSAGASKLQLWAVGMFLTIPLVMMAGGTLFALLDPERLAGHIHYVRNFRLIQSARGGVMLGIFGWTMLAWFASCFLVLKAKKRSPRWLALALLGPAGLAILSSLRSLGTDASTLYERFNRRLKPLVRILYEAVFFVLGLNVAWQMMLIKREAIISMQSASMGVSRQQIIDQQNASSGMWAFGELNEVMYFLALIYLLRPICVDVIGALVRSRRPPPAVA